MPILHYSLPIFMRNSLLLAAALGLTILCWGMYGPVLQWGQAGMSTAPGHVARLRPFVCVGLAYFLIGVIVPGVWLYLRGEKGEWSLPGIVWSRSSGRNQDRAFRALRPCGGTLAWRTMLAPG